jgi:hypothetical protein
MASPGFPELPRQVADLLDAKKYAEAIPLLRSMEERGSRSARVALGTLCVQGLVDPGDLQVIPWLRAAAEDGNRKAMLQLARGLIDASNSAGELREADFWLAKLEGDTAALRRVCLEAANAEPAKRMYWLRKGAAHDSIECMRLLWEATIGADTAEALGWLWRAAELGDAAAVEELARLYLEAREVPADPWSALFWYRGAASRLRRPVDAGVVTTLRAQALAADAAQLAAHPASGAPEVLMVTLGWKVDRGGVTINESGFVQPSAPCTGQRVDGNIYRIAEPPQYCIGVAQDDLVAVCRGYGGRLYVAERVHKSGKAHVKLVAEPDRLGQAGWKVFRDGLNAFGVSFNIPSEKIAPDIELAGGSIVLTRDSPAALLPLIEYLDNWGWEVEWNYIDPSLEELRAVYPRAPQPDSHPWPLKFEPDSPDNVTRFTFSVPRGPTFDCVAMRPKDGICEIILPPFRAVGISAGDRYASRGPVWRSTNPATEKSPNRTFWIACEFVRLKSDPMFRALTEIGCALSAHTGTDRNVCVTVPPNVPLDAVVGHLTSQRNAGRRFKAWLCDPGPERQIA